MARVPFYRLRNGAEHFYTASAAERDSAIANYGYVLEGIACYLADATNAIASLRVLAAGFETIGSRVGIQSTIRKLQAIVKDWTDA